MNKHTCFTSRGFNIAVIGLACCGAGSAMAASTSAGTTSTVITPINITKAADLSFGNIAPGAVDGTVTLTPGGARSAGGGAVLAGGTPTAAQFNVSGEGGKTYTLTVTATTLTSGGNSLSFVPISDFSASAVTTSNTAGGTLAGTGSSGAQSIYVGGALTVPANQPAGTYTGSVTASVDYN